MYIQYCHADLPAHGWEGELVKNGLNGGARHGHDTVVICLYIDASAKPTTTCLCALYAQYIVINQNHTPHEWQDVRAKNPKLVLLEAFWCLFHGVCTPAVCHAMHFCILHCLEGARVTHPCVAAPVLQIGGCMELFMYHTGFYNV